MEHHFPPKYVIRRHVLCNFLILIVLTQYKHDRSAMAIAVQSLGYSRKASNIALKLASQP